MIYLCCNKQRRLLLRQENDRRKANGLTPLNGMDFLEVLDREAPEGVGDIERQNTLLVRLFEPVPAFTADNVRIEGGERVTPVRAVWAFPANAIPAGTVPSAAERNHFAGLSQADHILVVRTDSTGDYSPYRLSLVKGPNNLLTPNDFDPLFSVAEFSFKVECPSDFDCAPRKICPPRTEIPPPIDYLAKDYASFRRLMLDRMALLMPQYRERNPADLGVALVELLAYVADHLSYAQDAVATEAYLESARRRISVRRHARLVDYHMHDGCNARTWAQVLCDRATSGLIVPARTPLLSRVIPGQQRLSPTSAQAEQAMRLHPIVFATMSPLTLFGVHSAMQFYTWGDDRCCLPKGATRATLDGHFPNLEARDVLIFAEVVNPRTGDPVGADRTLRHAVRLVEVRAHATGGGSLRDLLNGREITEIRWDSADALPKPLCISAVTELDHGERPLTGVTEAWGNIVLADHGETVRKEEIGAVPRPKIFRFEQETDRCRPLDPVPIPPRFRPTLKRLPLTQACAYDATQPAVKALDTSPASALPSIVLESTDRDGAIAEWFPQSDLLNSQAESTEFVAEVERDGTTQLRFGDDIQGRRPEAETTFTAKDYRVGNGKAGNIGADSLYHIITPDEAIIGVRNPLPGRGGADPETMDEVRTRAPFAFRTQDRAVTEADYAEKAELNSEVQRAAATFRWTGSWHTVFVTVDRLGGDVRNAALRREFEDQVLEGLERYRMAGHDLEADEPRLVSLEIEMHICVKGDYFRSDVHSALLEVFTNRILPDGRRGVFHPDNFTFGQPVHLSPLYSAAQAVPGVASVHITTFQRHGLPSDEALRDGKLVLDRLEIARCDNNPNFPEHGVLKFHLGGGK